MVENIDIYTMLQNEWDSVTHSNGILLSSVTKEKKEIFKLHFIFKNVKFPWSTLYNLLNYYQVHNVGQLLILYLHYFKLVYLDGI